MEAVKEVLLSVLSLVLGLVMLALTVSVVGYLALIAASHAYISGGLAEYFFGAENANPFWSYLSPGDWPAIHDGGATHLERLTAVHAIRNLVCVVGTAILAIVILPIGMFIGGVVMAVAGVVTVDWGGFGMGVGMVVGAPFVAVLSVLGSLFFWLALVIQPATPGYLLVFILGLPVIAPLLVFVGSIIPVRRLVGYVGDTPVYEVE